MKFTLEIWTKCFLDERIYRLERDGFRRFKNDYEALLKYLKSGVKPCRLNRGVCLDDRGFGKLLVSDAGGVCILTCDLCDINSNSYFSSDFDKFDDSCFAVDSRLWSGKVFRKSYLGSFSFDKLKLLVGQIPAGKLASKVLYDAREYSFDDYASLGEFKCGDIYLEKSYS